VKKYFGYLIPRDFTVGLFATFIIFLGCLNLKMEIWDEVGFNGAASIWFFSVMGVLETFFWEKSKVF
jgi:hypothetical protein